MKEKTMVVCNVYSTLHFMQCSEITWACQALLKLGSRNFKYIFVSCNKLGCLRKVLRKQATFLKHSSSCISLRRWIYVNISHRQKKMRKIRLLEKRTAASKGWSTLWQHILTAWQFVPSAPSWHDSLTFCQNFWPPQPDRPGRQDPAPRAPSLKQRDSSNIIQAYQLTLQKK